MTKNTKTKLLGDLSKLASDKMYMFSPEDFFALGYLAGKYNLSKLNDFDGQEVIKACAEYDKTDDLGLLDTIGEVLIDNGFIDNSKNII